MAAINLLSDSQVKKPKRATPVMAAISMCGGAGMASILSFGSRSG